MNRQKGGHKEQKLDTDLMVKAAQMYYRDDMRQNEIADELNLTQSRVSILIKEAKQQGFVKVFIEPPVHKDLEQEIMECHPHLKEVVIVDCPDDSRLKGELGKAAALYFDRNVKNEDVIALSCGTTIAGMIGYLTPNNYTVLEVAPLQITGVERMVGWTPVSLISKLISKYDSTGVIGYGYQLPPFIGSPKYKGRLKEYYLENPFVEKALKKAKEADFTFIGIGGIQKKQNAFEFSRFVEDHGLVDLVCRSEAIGEICYQPFDKSGNILIEEEVFKDLKNRFLYVPMQDLVEKAVSDYYRVVAVAGGKAKRKVLYTSLKMRCYNVLICDITIAESLCLKE
jgi:DNA-binding transcriptional regulator LsrR (DeoR family)